jgi:hypothetical protein
MLPFRAASQPGLTVLAEMARFMVRGVYIPEQLHDVIFLTASRSLKISLFFVAFFDTHLVRWSFVSVILYYI